MSFPKYMLTLNLYGITSIFFFLLVHLIQCSLIVQFLSKDFLNADPNCPGNVVTAFEMLEKLKNQGPEGTKFIHF